MYTGSTLCFLGTALWCVARALVLSRSLFQGEARLMHPFHDHRYEAPAGLLLTALVYVVYQVALAYEECVVLAPLPSSARQRAD